MGAVAVVDLNDVVGSESGGSGDVGGEWVGVDDVDGVGGVGGERVGESGNGVAVEYDTDELVDDDDAVDVVGVFRVDGHIPMERDGEDETVVVDSSSEGYDLLSTQKRIECEIDVGTVFEVDGAHVVWE